jgi:hypothetical protein
MKRISSIITLILCVISLTTFGQRTIEDIKKGNYGTPEERAKQADDMMQKGLELTQQQQPTVKEINLRYAWRVENEVVKMKLGSWASYNKISAIQNNKDKELQNILNKTQFSKYKKKRDELFWAGIKTYFF